MGNGPSSRRNGRIQQHNQNPAPPPRMVPPPPGYPGNPAPHPGLGPYQPNGHHGVPYFFPPSNYNGGMAAPMGPPQFYPHGYMPSNGQYMMNIQPHGFRAPPNSAPQAHTPPPIAETQKANTIRNDVNLKKATLRLEKDDENPAFHRVAFSFDATVDGW